MPKLPRQLNQVRHWTIPLEPCDSLFLERAGRESHGAPASARTPSKEQPHALEDSTPQLPLQQSAGPKYPVALVTASESQSRTRGALDSQLGPTLPRIGPEHPRTPRTSHRNQGGAALEVLRF